MSNDELIMKNFNELFSVYRDRFILFAISYVDNKEAAEDIVTDSFMYYWEKRAELADASKIPGYILTTVKHKCLNHLKRKLYIEKALSEIKSHQSRVTELNISSLEACEPQELLARELKALIMDTLRQLPELTRTIFIKSRLNNKTYKEIGYDLNISEKSIEYHLTKAVKILKENLKDYLHLLILLSFFK
jgi:RNA polymerase sigma-70 factor (ECF subfamily)